MAKNPESYTVFLIDDDTKLLTMMKHYLAKNSEYNLHIHSYASGEDALRRLDLKPDVVVLDYYFDAIDEDASTGLEVMGKFKAELPECEVVMISGQDDMEVTLESIRAGAFDYVIKNEHAVMRTHLTVNKILLMKDKKQEMVVYKRNMQILVIVLIIFLVMMGLLFFFWSMR